jgi:hypothetical protein
VRPACARSSKSSLPCPAGVDAGGDVVPVDIWTSGEPQNGQNACPGSVGCPWGQANADMLPYRCNVAEVERQLRLPGSEILTGS